MVDVLNRSLCFVSAQHNPSGELPSVGTSDLFLPKIHFMCNSTDCVIRAIMSNILYQLFL